MFSNPNRIKVETDKRKIPEKKILCLEILKIYLNITCGHRGSHMGSRKIFLVEQSKNVRKQKLAKVTNGTWKKL